MTALAVVMDMDGLMVDSEPLSRRAWDQVLARYGYVLNDDTYNRIIGYRADESTAMVIKAYDLPVGVDDFMREKAEALAKIRVGGVPVMPGLFEFHANILRKGVPWGVATSSPRAHAEETIEQLGLSTSCQTVAGGDEVSRGKPAPDIYLLAAERLGIPARRCLAVEDSAPGCRSALAAGMMVAAVPNGATKAADFSAVNHVFPSLHHVSEMFEALLAELADR
jgi:HAD superfamily hydrolase (TIGR01509 family)